MGALGWLVAHQLRVRWRSVLGLAVLVGLAGGLVLATGAGARRTSSAFDRFLAETGTRDAAVQFDEDGADAVLSRIERLDIVARSGRVEIIPVLPTDESLLTEVDLALFASPDGRWGAAIDRPVVLEGRLPDPSATDEVLLNELAAQQTGLGIGDRIRAATFTPEQLDALHAGGVFDGFGGPEVDLRVVGVGRQANDLQGADIAAGGVLLVSPALHDVLDGSVGALSGLVAVTLTPGATVADLRDEVRRIVGPEDSFDVRSAEEEFAASVRDATGVLANALAAFAAVAAVAAAVAVGGAISRQCAVARGDAPSLAAIGCDRRQRGLTTAAVPAAGTSIGIVAAVVAAWVASGWFPLSIARRVEPDPGLRFDALVQGGGALVLLVVAGTWLLVTVRRLEHPSDARAARRPRTSLALPPTAAIGIGHAFDRRSDGRAVPVRAALVAAALGVVGVVAAATVVRSYDALVDDPSRYGWAWSAEPDLYTDDPVALADELATSQGVSAVGVRHNARLELEGLVLEGVAFEDHHGTIEPPVRAGRLPSAPDEVLLGQHTADEIGVSVGDRVSARTADGAGAIVVEVVGIGVLAPVETTDPASGAVVTMDGLERLRRSDGFRSMLVRYEPGFDPRSLEASLAERELADFSVVYAKPRLSGGLENLGRAMPIVAALGAFFVVLAVVGVSHALVLGTRRRRRELATLRALGMRRRQIRGVVVVSAVATAATGLVVGVPLGLVLGRTAWRVVIDGHGLLDAPSVPWMALVVVVPASILVAVLVSWWPGVSVSRRPSLALRSE